MEWTYSRMCIDVSGTRVGYKECSASLPAAPFRIEALIPSWGGLLAAHGSQRNPSLGLFLASGSYLTHSTYPSLGKTSPSDWSTERI